MNPAIIVVIVVVALVIVLLIRTIRVIPQSTAGIVERFGRYHRTLGPGHNVVVPFIDRLRPLLDLREQVISFPPQPVTTSDNLVVTIDIVMYYQVVDAKAATYEVANFITSIEQLTMTRLHEVIGAMDLEHALQAREETNQQIRTVIEEKVQDWGVRAKNVEIKSIDSPPAIQESMEKEVRADRDKRAALNQAEGEKQAAIRAAEGAKQAAVLRAEGDAESQAVRARGQADAISTLVQAIHQEDPDNRLLAYQYIQMLPQIAEGSSNKVWIVPSGMGKALESLGSLFDSEQGWTGSAQANGDDSASST